MRVMVGVIVLCCGCGALHEASACPRPCPASCPTSCFPTGYCRSAVYQPQQSPPVVREQGFALRVAFGDLPETDWISHSSIDLAARAQTIPWDYTIRSVSSVPMSSCRISLPSTPSIFRW